MRLIRWTLCTAIAGAAIACGDSGNQPTAAPPAPPADWIPIIRAGMLPGIPVDPTREAPYEIDSMARVQVSRRSTLFPLPVEPKRLITPPGA